MAGGAAFIDSIVVEYIGGDALYVMSAVDTVTINQAICEGMTYEDEHFTTGEEGTHTYFQTNGEYCATLYILNLSIVVRDMLHHSADACDFYTLENVPYTQSQQVFLVTPATEPYGCPVVDEWNITIRHSSEGDVWNGEVYEESGDYTQTLTNASGCDSVVTLHLTINTCDTIGIPTYNDGFLAVYPNPTSGIVTLQLTSETCLQNSEIQLFDIYGKRLQVMAVTGETTQIDLSTYSTGVYLVKLVSNEKVIGVQKVVKR